MDWLTGVAATLMGLSFTIGVLSFILEKQQKTLEKMGLDIIELKIKLARIEERLKIGGRKK